MSPIKIDAQAFTSLFSPKWTRGKTYFLIGLALLLSHFYLFPKDNNIEHSRELSLQYAIDAMYDGYPLYTSNQHIYESLYEMTPEYKTLYGNHPKYEPIETTWEDPGYFYWAFYLSSIKKIFSNEKLDILRLHWIQFASVLLFFIFSLSIANMVDPRLKVVCVLHILFLIVSRNIRYSMVGHFSYGVVAFYMFYLLIGFAFLWKNLKKLPADSYKNMIPAFIWGAAFPIFVKQIRSDSGTIALFCFLVFSIALLFRAMVVLDKISWKKVGLMVLVLFAFIGATNGLKELARQHREKVQPNANAQIEKFVGGHPIWISFYTGFGYLPNIMNFKVSDEDAIMAVVNRYGLVPYQTNEFETSLRTIVFDAMKDNPWVFPKTVAIKIFDLLRVRHSTVPIHGLRGYYDPLFLLGFFHLLFCLWIYRSSIFGDHIYYLGLLFLLGLSLAPALIREPYTPYSILFNNLLFGHIILILSLFFQKRVLNKDSRRIRRILADVSNSKVNFV